MAGELIGATAGPHYLQIDADGAWNIVVEQPRYTSASALPQTISGHGPSVSIPFTLASGAVKFTMTHNGVSNFAVILYANNGDYVDLLANEIGGNITEAKERLSQTKKFNYRKVIIVIQGDQLRKLNDIIKFDELKNWIEAWSIPSVYLMYQASEQFFSFYSKLEESRYVEKKEIKLV